MLKVEYIVGFFDGEGSIGIYVNGQGVWHLRTQLTQNITKDSTFLLSELYKKYGGNLSKMKSSIYRKGAAYNWQLNSESAVNFLKEILPFLVLKKDQAQYAIAWQSIKQIPQRDKNGRMMAFDKNRKIDSDAAKLLKALKKDDIDAVMAAQGDLVDILYTLKQLLCVKG